MSSPARKRTAIAATALAGIAATSAIADPAAGAVRAGRNVSIFSNIDFVSVFGYPLGQAVTVDVLRGGHRIATVTAPTVSTATGPGLEVNHGPVGAARPGDCWDRFTPDIRPGDQIRVRDATGTDSVDVDDIRITTPAFRVGTATGDLQLDDVVVEGVARRAGGTPIPTGELDSGEVRNTSNLRATPSSVVALDAQGGWRAVYRAPYNGLRNDNGLSGASLVDALVTGAHAMGYGLVPVPPPAVTQVVDGPDVPGPALGCEASPPPDASTATTLDDKVVNIASEDLEIGGVVADAAAAGPIEVTVSDAQGDSVLAGPQGVSSGPGQRGWSAIVARDQLDTLADGELSVATRFGTTAANTLKISKDVVAPREVFANPPPGPTYEGTQFVRLSTGDPTDVIRYRRGSSPTLITAGWAISLTQSETLTVTVTDGAGNTRDPKPFAYSIVPAPPRQDGGAATPPAPQPIVLPGPGPAAPAPGPAAAEAPGPLALRMLVLTPRQKRSRVAREGLRVAMRVPEGTELVRVRIYRRKRSGRRALLAERLRVPPQTGLFRLRLSDARLRRDLQGGAYELEATPGRSRADFGTPARFAFAISRSGR